MPTDQDMQADGKSMRVKLNVESLRLEQLMKNAECKHDKIECKQKAQHKRFTKHPSCRKVKGLLDSTAAELVIFTVILFNFALTIYETDIKSSTPEQPAWLSGCFVGFIMFYVIELSLRFYADGFSFFSDMDNVMDLTIVLIDVVCAIIDMFSRTYIPGSAFLRIFRVARVFRLMRHFRELYLMMFSLIATMKAIFWAVVLILLLLTCCSVIAVDVLHPINVKVMEDGGYEDSCPRCPDAFRTVWEANLTFIQQILAGDSWGAVTLPIINKAPWTLFFFLFVLLIVNLGLMNLVLTVIVDQASEARNSNVESMILDKMQEFKAAKRGLLALCAEMDTDHSGGLTLEELLNGYDSNPHFANYMTAMDTTRDDIPEVYKMMDHDLLGYVSYGDFVDQMHKLRTQDTHTMIVFMHFELQDLKRKLREFFQWEKTTQVTNWSKSVLPQSEERAQRGKEVPDGEGRLTASLAGDAQGELAVNDVGHVTEARCSDRCLRMQSSARESNNVDVEEDTLVAARADVHPESKHVQSSIANAIDSIVQESLATSRERLLALTRHPDFLDLLHAPATNQRTHAHDISIADCFLPAYRQENNKINRHWL